MGGRDYSLYQYPEICLKGIISRSRRRVNEIIALLEYCATLIGSLLPTFRDKLSFPSSRKKQSKKNEKAQKPFNRVP
jgi:hypothetical protein